MSTPTERLLAKFQRARRSGRSWLVQCPAHDDRSPSLSISEGDDGRALLCCHAGCTVDSVCDALGIRKVELFSEQGNGYTRGLPARPSPPPTTYPTARDAVAVLEQRLGRPAAWWTYHNADGEPVGVVVRWDTASGKEIRPVSRRGEGWVVGAMPAPRPLYRLLELADIPRVYITEGEKAADAARSLRMIATTSAGGSKAAGKTDWAPLAGLDIVILPDNDDAGRRYSDDVAAILATLSPAPVVRVIELPGLPPGGDMADFVAAKGGGR